MAIRPYGRMRQVKGEGDYPVMRKVPAREDLSAPAYLKSEGMKIEAVRAPGKRGSSAPVKAVRSLSDFKAAFDADAGRARLVVLFSPT